MAFYVFPSPEKCELIIDERAISRYPEFAANLISGCRIFGPKGTHLESMAVWEAIREHELSPLLDGYVSGVIPEGFPRVILGNILAVKRSLTRANNILTVFFEVENSLWVSKLTPTSYSDLIASRQGEDFYFSVREPVYSGVIYELLVQNMALKKDWPGVFECLQRFFDVSFARFSLDTDTLVGLAIDAIPRNAVIDAQGNISFFDLEFSDYGAVNKSFFIYRVCTSIMGRKGYLFDGCGCRCIYDVYKWFCLHYGLHVNVRREMALESSFQSMVAGSAVGEKIKISRALRDFSKRKNIFSKVFKVPRFIEIVAVWLFDCLRTRLYGCLPDSK